MRKTTGNNDSQQILLEHSISINKKKKSSFTDYKKPSTTEVCIAIVLNLEINGNTQEHSVLSLSPKNKHCRR